LDISKEVLRGKFIAMSAYLKNTERSQTNDIMLHLKLLEKQDEAKLKTSRGEIIKYKGQNQQNRDKNIKISGTKS
jgi:23S rRNA maturation-related 3'-5' exoribonuclease YhaM